MPTIQEMERDAPLWHRLNTALLNVPGFRVIFLRRRNSFQRFVSDHVGHETGHWGYVDLSVRPDESARYKKMVSKVPLPPLNEELCRWYTQNIPRIFQRLRDAVINPVMDVWYEDFFGSDVGLDTRIDRFRGIVEFLQIRRSEEFFASPELALLLRPSAKLNDTSVLERIPNYRELREIYQRPETQDLVPAPVDPSSHARKINTDRPHFPAPQSRVPAEGAIGLKEWRLRSAAGCLANLWFPPDEPDSVRVEMEKAGTPNLYDIQLNANHRKLEPNRTYILYFRVRADRPRSIHVGVSQGRDPWSSLGLYEKVEVAQEWSDCRREFVATGGDDQARLHFDLGDCAVPIELSQVCLYQQSPWEKVLQQELAEARQRELSLRQEVERQRDEQVQLAQEMESLEKALEEARTQVYQLMPPPTRTPDLHPPSGAFTETPPEHCPWRLRVVERNAARLFAAAGNPHAFRVVMDRAVSQIESDIQLNFGGLILKAHHRYSIHLRVRSDRPRTIGIGVAKAYAPWNNLGFYQRVLLLPEWQTIHREFESSEADRHARLHLDLGGRTSAVEIADFQLQESGGPSVVPAAAESILAAEYSRQQIRC